MSFSFTGLCRARLSWLLGGLLVLGCFAIYARVPEFDFVAFDDDHNIVFNPHLGPLSFTRVAWAFSDWEYVRRYMPLGWLGFSAVFGWSGLNPAGWHLANAVLHVGGTLLLFLVLRALVRTGHASTPEPGWTEVAAFLGAAFWAWHPLRAETVGWSSGLLYGQVHVLLLGAIACRWCAPGWPASRALAVLLYACSLLTYPVALGFAPVFGLFTLWRGGSWREAGRETAPFALIAALVLAATIMARWAAAPVPTLTEFPLAARGFQAAYLWLYYLWRVFWPFDLTPVNTTLLDHPPTFASAVTLVALVGAGLAWSRSRWFVIAHLCVLAPLLGLMEETAFPSDRYAALPNAVLAAALTLTLARLRAPRMHWALTAIIAVALLGAAGLSQRQVEIWRDTAQLHRRISTQIGPGGAPAYSIIFHARWRLREGEAEAALALLDEGLARHPHDAALQTVRHNLADMARDNRSYAAALGLSRPPPYGARLHWQMARDLARTGEVAAAAVHLGEVRRIAPEYYARVTLSVTPTAQ